MNIGKNLFSLILPAISIVLMGCQKEDLNEPIQKVSICPEIANNNFEEAGLMINEFLTSQRNDETGNLSDKLVDYLEKCNCVDTISVSSVIDNTYPAVQEYSIIFIMDGDTIHKVMDVYLYGDSKIEFHKFHN
jgi:hypothetical protein